MPYYVFAVRPFAQLEQLAEFARFPDASAHAKSLRAAQSPDDRTRIRVIFAADTIGAEDLLLQVRDAPTGADE